MAWRAAGGVPSVARVPAGAGVVACGQAGLAAAQLGPQAALDALFGAFILAAFWLPAARPRDGCVVGVRASPQLPWAALAGFGPGPRWPRVV